MCADGMRATVLAVIVLPSVAVVGAAAAGSAVPITVVVSVARARPRTMRDASVDAMMLVSKPSSETASVGPLASGGKANVPSPPVTTVAITASPLRSCTIAPGSGRPV